MGDNVRNSESLPPFVTVDTRHVLHKTRMSTWLHSRGKPMPVEDLSEDQINDIRECFDLFDADGSGALDMDEVMEACNVLGLDSGDGKGGMISHLMEEMEGNGIDELDYDQFETVVCRTLGDIALEKSRSHSADAGLHDNEQATDVLAGTRDRAMVFKRKQLLGNILRGGANLSELAGAQEELLNEIAARFKRVVKTDGKRSKAAQLAELLNDEDPIANAVAPGLSMRFKHLATMADTKMGQIDALTRSCTPETKERSRGKSSQQGGPHRSAAVMTEKSILFGGDVLEIRPRTEKPRTHMDSLRVLTSADARAMLQESQRQRAVAKNNNKDEDVEGSASMPADDSADFIAKGISTLAANHNGGTVIRSIRISDCFRSDSPSTSEQGEPLVLQSVLAGAHQSELDVAASQHHYYGLHFKNFPSTQRIHYSKRLPTSNPATPAIALLSGPVVPTPLLSQPHKLSPVPRLPLQKVVPPHGEDLLLCATSFQEAAQCIHQPLSEQQMGGISKDLDKAAPGWGKFRSQTSRLHNNTTSWGSGYHSDGFYSDRPSHHPNVSSAVALSKKTKRRKNGYSNDHLPTFELVSGQWLAGRTLRPFRGSNLMPLPSRRSPERRRHALPPL